MKKAQAAESLEKKIAAWEMELENLRKVINSSKPRRRKLLRLKQLAVIIADGRSKLSEML